MFKSLQLLLFTYIISTSSSRLLCNNSFEGNIPSEIGKRGLLSDVHCNERHAASAGVGCMNRKFGRWWDFIHFYHVDDLSVRCFLFSLSVVTICRFLFFFFLTCNFWTALGRVHWNNHRNQIPSRYHREGSYFIISICSHCKISCILCILMLVSSPSNGILFTNPVFHQGSSMKAIISLMTVPTI